MGVEVWAVDQVGYSRHDDEEVGAPPVVCQVAVGFRLVILTDLLV